jgi:hypothetical protein
MAAQLDDSDDETEEYDVTIKQRGMGRKNPGGGKSNYSSLL